MRYSSAFKAALPLAALFASTAALAQSADTSATGASGSQLDEVLVTARRRDEALADVPVAVTVMNAAALEARGVHTEADLQIAMPGVVVRTSNNSNQLNY